VKTDSKSTNLYTTTVPRKNDERHVSKPIAKKRQEKKRGIRLETRNKVRGRKK
jgi:hypothetical protein